MVFCKHPLWLRVTFWEALVRFLSTRPDNLIYSILSNFVYLASSLFDYSWCSFSNLIFSVSASICKIIYIQEASRLTFSFFVSMVSTSSPSPLVNSFVFLVSLFHITRNPRGVVFLILKSSV